MTRHRLRFTPPTVAVGLAVLTILALGTPPVDAQQCPTLVWSDEFDGSAVDEGRWSFQVGDGCAEGICGWGNNEEQTYQVDNATVEGGALRIEAREERVRSKKYTSARLRTLGQGDWTFGRFEARIRMTQGQGIWPAFWMLPTDEVYGGWPQSGEIDIMENIGSEPDTVHGTIHFGDPWPGNRSSGASFRLHSGRFADGFHDFAIEKEPGVIRWFVDDVLYSTLTAADIAPSDWPFDERFHLLLNVAVGGDWPGSPDATTVFPQVLEVDWVRVWDGNRVHLAGERVVAHQANGVAYAVGNAPGGSSFAWTVPPGASIASGQGTSSITVDWGTTGGTVSVDVASGCGPETLSVEVAVEPPYERDFALENFDEPANMTFDSATGSLVEVANPDTSGINPSATSGEYIRNAAEQFDVLVYSTAAIPDAGRYADGVDRFYLDLWTDAPVGTTVLLQLEESAVATPSNYPSGRHSRYQAETTVQGAWERLALPFLDRPDGSTPDGAVDTLILLFAPDSFSGDVFTWDNLDSYTSEIGGADPVSAHVADIAPGTANAGKGAKRGTATVQVVDDLGGPVADASLTGSFSGDFAETVSGTTGADGTVTLSTDATAKGGVSFTFCVDALSHATLVYDPSMNVETCDGL